MGNRFWTRLFLKEQMSMVSTGNGSWGGLHLDIGANGEQHLEPRFWDIRAHKQLEVHPAGIQYDISYKIGDLRGRCKTGPFVSLVEPLTFEEETRQTRPHAARRPILDMNM